MTDVRCLRIVGPMVPRPMTDGPAATSESGSPCELARYLSIFESSFRPSVEARVWPVSDCGRRLLIGVRLLADRVSGSRPGAFQALCGGRVGFLHPLGYGPRWPGQFPKAHRPSAAQHATLVSRHPSQYPPVTVSTPARPGNVERSGTIGRLRPRYYERMPPTPTRSCPGVGLGRPPGSGPRPLAISACVQRSRWVS